MREAILGAPLLVTAALILIFASLQGDTTARYVVGATGLALLSAWAGAYLRGWGFTSDSPPPEAPEAGQPPRG